jgi:hypothetical protein
MFLYVYVSAYVFECFCVSISCLDLCVRAHTHIRLHIDVMYS